MRHLLLSVVSLALLAACGNTPSLNALHDPLYRAEDHTSTITAHATETGDGIAEVRIDAIVGELTACDSGDFVFPSLIPCRSRALASSVTCFFPNVRSEVTCTLPLAITDRRLVTYRATARSAANRSASTSPVTYAGGAPLTQARIRTPFAERVIPWETARPIIWRTDMPSSVTERGDKIDWGLLPDVDMPSYRAFTDDLQPILLALFYTDTRNFSAWTRTWRMVFNLWAGPVGADGEGCTRTYIGHASTVRSAFDGSSILHRNAFRDCGAVVPGGDAGTTQSKLADASWVMLHEAGHFLFGLGDEYAEAGSANFSVSTPKNVYPSQAECQSSSSANGLPPSQCSQIGSSGTWRNDDGVPTMMEDRSFDSDWRTFSGKALDQHLGRCLGGACY